MVRLLGHKVNCCTYGKGCVKDRIVEEQLNTEQAYKKQGHVTFKALCWLFLCNGGKRTTVEVVEK